MPWEETAEYIRSGHRSPDDFQPDSLRTITLSEEEGIKAIIGKPKGQDTTEVQSYLFAKDKGWTLDKAKAWFEQHGQSREHHTYFMSPFSIVKESLVEKPLKIKGVAMTAGMSRNLNIYTPEELRSFASKLVGSPVYLEHVSAMTAVGKVTNAIWDPQLEVLSYQAEIHDEETTEKIRRGLIQHVSVAADYESIDVVDGKIPHGLHNAELSLVAVPGNPEANVQVMEKLAGTKKGPVKIREQGDVVCAFCGQPADYLVSICQMCFDKVQSSQPAGVQTGSASPSAGVESLKEEDLKKLVDERVKAILKEQGEQDQARREQQQRSQKYGIGVKDGGNVTKPSEFSGVDDDQFADPVNYRYPIDKDHVDAALKYFNQPGNRQAGGYTHEEAVKIMAKIIQSALANGIEVSWQPEDPVYRDLPEELKAKMKGYTQTQGGSVGGSMAEALVSSQSQSAEDMVSKKKILECIPDESIIRSWKAPGAVTTIRKILYAVTGKATK